MTSPSARISKALIAIPFLEQGALIAFWAYLFLIPFKPVLNSLHSPLRSACIAIMLLYLAQLWLKSETRNLPPDRPILAYAGAMALSVLLSFDFKYSLSCYFRSLIPMLVIYFAGSRLITNSKRLYNTALIIAFAGSISIVMVLLQSHAPYARLEGFFATATRLGKFLDLILPVTIAIALTDGNQIIRGLASLSSICQITALFSTGTRGAIFSLALIGLISAYFNRSLAKILLLLLIMAGILFLITPQHLLPKHRIKHFVSKITHKTIAPEQILKARIEIWKSSLMLFEQRPLLGWGYGNHIERKVLSKIGYEWLNKKGIHPPEIYHAHNIFLETLVEGGILAFSALIWLIITMLSYLRSLMKAQIDGRIIVFGFLCGLVAIGLHSMISVPQWINSNLAMAYIGVIAGIMKS